MGKLGGRWTKARRLRQSRTIREFWKAHPDRLWRGKRPAEYRAMKSEQTRKLWQDPEYRARAALWTRERRYALSLRRVSEETRARMSASAKARWAALKASGHAGRIGGARETIPSGPQDAAEPEPVKGLAEAAAAPGHGGAE